MKRRRHTPDQTIRSSREADRLPEEATELQRSPNSCRLRGDGSLVAGRTAAG
jgi:hypothetical protein